jgi:Flp pilus assembly protein TadD
MEQNGNLEGAKEIYKKTLRKIPNYRPALNNLAYILLISEQLFIW